jgi:hypothetical protein
MSDDRGCGMNRSAEMLVLMAVLAGVALVAWACYRWACRRRVRLVQGWVRDELAGQRGGRLPGNLTIDCSDDRIWPVLVSFDAPEGGRTRARYSCSRGRDSLRQIVKW